MLLSMAPGDVVEGAALDVRQVEPELHLPRDIVDLLLLVPGVSVPAVEISFRGQRLPALAFDKLVSTPEILVQDVFNYRMKSEVHEPLVQRQDVLHHVPVRLGLLIAVKVVPPDPPQAH